jgi:hypothetical protein
VPELHKTNLFSQAGTSTHWPKDKPTVVLPKFDVE